MTNYTIINQTALKKALKPDMKKGAVHIQRKDGYGYVCNGYFIAKMPEIYLNEFVQPVALHDMPAEGVSIVCKSGKWSNDGADLEKLMSTNAAQAEHAAENLNVSISGGEKKKKALKLYAVNGQIVALDALYVDIIDDSTYTTHAKGGKAISPIVVTSGETLDSSESAVLVLPVRYSTNVLERLQKLASCIN